MGCHFLLQRIFLTQGSNLSLLCLLHGRWYLHPLSPQEARSPYTPEIFKLSESTLCFPGQVNWSWNDLACA